MSDDAPAAATPSPRLMDGWLTQKELAKELSVSVDTLQRWHNQRIGPPRVKVGGKAYYHIESVHAWMKAREEGPV